MEKILLDRVDTVYGQRKVEFTGVKLGTRTAKNPNDDTRGATQIQYCVKDEQYIKYLIQWKDRQDNPIRCSLTAITEPDFLPPPVEVGEPDRGRPLTLDEALTLSLPPQSGWLD